MLNCRDLKPRWLQRLKHRSNKSGLPRLLGSNPSRGVPVLNLRINSKEDIYFLTSTSFTKWLY